ncbi:MAG TPA: FecR domain-containing protein [Steroidobacteraceae bacterium]|nr:FecR domain-containing protein [Steroidobacteraceae bacterium]
MSSVQDEAAAWVVRFDGRAPEAEQRAAFDDWIGRSPAHTAAYENALQTWRDLAAMRGSEQYRSLLGKPTLRERLVGTLRAPRWVAAAGGVAAIVAVVWLGLSLDALPFLQRPTQVTTDVAEVRRLTLPDGTRIVLGAQSQIDYVVTDSTRRATVMSGDAFFAVAHDSARPFTVAAGDYTVSVVGTQFEIRRRPGMVRVAVSEGRVAVGRAGESAASVLPSGAAWTAGASGVEVHPVDAFDVGAWRLGRLFYDNATLRDIVADANRYTRTRIVVADPQLEDLRLTTSFRTSQVDGMVETLQAALPLVAERQASGEIVLRARH